MDVVRGQLAAKADKEAKGKVGHGTEEFRPEHQVASVESNAGQRSEGLRCGLRQFNAKREAVVAYQ